MRIIDPADLVPMDLFEGDEALRVEVAYAREDNLLFAERIYRPDARLWLHKDLAAVIVLAARICKQRLGLRFVLYDGLRTTDAQAAMARTRRALDNPHWIHGTPRLLSPPGGGGHCRAMAVDIGLEQTDGTPVNMGTPFDFLAENALAEHNPAHREHPHLAQDIRQNRAKLDQSILAASAALGIVVEGLAQEWWDFRFPDTVYNQYAPLSDRDLPGQMRMTVIADKPLAPDFDTKHFEMMKKSLLRRLVPYSDLQSFEVN